MNLAFEVLRIGRHTVAVVLVAALVGCASPKLPTVTQLSAFEQAGPLRPEVDRDQLIRARIPAGPYRVIAGDVLQLQMPTVMQAVATDISDKTVPHFTRVSQADTISLPIVGQIPVAGKTLAEIEQDVVAAYHPKYVKNLPSVIASVAEYSTVGVSVVGAVVNPGVYRLRSDEMSLVTLIMKAGGIVEDGAGLIRIHGDDRESNEPLVVPVKGLNVPFADVALAGGETVEIERLEQEVFTVTGLVRKPDTFAYPPGVQYSLTQALAFAGGVDDTADPRYAKIYRQAADGQVLAAVFRISDKHTAEASKALIKQGDIVAVENTSRTRTRRALADFFRVSTGIYAGATYDLNPNK